MNWLANLTGKINGFKEILGAPKILGEGL